MDNVLIGDFRRVGRLSVSSLTWEKNKFVIKLMKYKFENISL